MSVSPTEDALIVALYFEGELEYIIPYGFKFCPQQASTVSSVPLRRNRFSFSSILLFRIS
jgi:hypothetical protein